MDLVRKRKMNRQKLKEELAIDEGLKLKPYKDTVGKLTIGYGRNLDDRGISIQEAQYLLDADIQLVEIELDRKLPWWRLISESRKRALANMCFNMGISKLLGFKNMLEAMKGGDFDKAKKEALDSLWARQVGKRAQRIVALLDED
jgi:lysozyme